MLHIHLLNSNEVDLKETITSLQHEKGSVDENATGQQQPSSDKRVHMVMAEEKVHEEQAGSKKYRKDVPNYFVAIPVTSEQILDKIEDVQELIFTKEPKLLKALIPVQTMHLTIIAAHLRTDEDVKRAVSALEHSKAKVQTLLQGKLFSMTFQGIGQFNNQVVYVKMSEDEQQMLSKIAEAVESSFMEMNVDITASNDFRPHLTFLKLSKAPALRRKGFRKIHEDLYTEYEESPFGTEILNRIDLCAMHKKKQDSGYYHCEHSICVGPSSSEDNEDKEEPGDDPREEVHCVSLSDHTKANCGRKDSASQNH
ncbi:A-kinase anchor protein 7-like [Sceloporus undulatus]|uniref:A-kinase anchor protein 7-like n=1 Tax=Sceloporus undulatus TaxID=8520 RepID=UPI001C4CF17A|nr:A-kinase anchor protein 7-like [Sceloporus undulatus]XP_042299094.1 A-kinase anchor protein 7-like [Sceloporus undulatus]